MTGHTGPGDSLAGGCGRGIGSESNTGNKGGKVTARISGLDN